MLFGCYFDIYEPKEFLDCKVVAENIVPKYLLTYTHIWSNGILYLRRTSPQNYSLEGLAHFYRLNMQKIIFQELTTGLNEKSFLISFPLHLLRFSMLEDYRWGYKFKLMTVIWRNSLISMINFNSPDPLTSNFKRIQTNLA